ncbi:MULTISPECIES: sugar kinase [Streptomyces]|uniref:sugar kinase n=1 Tax=Streptomyces TaxID=1883 RepID=UPI0008E3891B|nr:MULTISPECIES: sugar kinase [unclassified Streptomyces]SFN77403.1 2-dehydro-3-deoxygluconokinase [Streptomyces sp. cf124]
MTADGLRSPDAAPAAVDVVALGESMVTFLPTRPGRLADVPSFDRAIGGAESNVACALAAAGHTARWVSQVGADGFGDHLLEEIGSYGVDVTSVRRDPARPTGVYFRTAADRATDTHEVAYYRAGSAASAMSTRTVDLAAVHAGRVLHLSGITAALSDDCLRLLRDLTAPRPDHHPLVSFDVNHRPGLWRDSDGPRVLLELARRADLVFVGEDEAQQAWGVTGGPTAIRTLLPEPTTLVVKQGARGATLFVRTPPRPDRPRTDGRGRAGGCPPAAGVHHRARPHPTAPAGPRTETPRHVPDPTPTAGDPETTRTEPVTDTTTFVPAPTVQVAAATGAGDAFAAGFLSATLRALPAKARLRHGHLMAAATLTVPGDLAVPPRRDHADRLAALDDDAWGTLRLAPGWTDAPDRAEEEVHTP